VSEYTPDTWVVLRIISIKDDNAIFYRLLSGWIGGYAQSDAWRLNSGITKFEDADTHWIVHGQSGSVYRCHKNSYRWSTLTFGKYTEWQKTLGEDNIQMMPEATDWLNVNWGLNNA
jgi:hypothetical protein